ncbi:AzlD domain-containing protein [Paenibacillus aestuarii]|uniref:AzlD domain-containing protein n=1 Tax=Paenibacillus aestuarii TaxID=516965 RepID=A0ABW0KJ93_9BACL|nr:AzlD domain-containing protein [Paenibacillus aestuarii]
MEIRWYIFLIIVGSSIVTVLPRVLPLIVLSRIQLPDWGMRWLNYVPVAVMAALVGQELLLQDGNISILHNIELLAALPTFAVAIFTRSLLGTVVVGIVSMMILRLL